MKLKLVSTAILFAFFLGLNHQTQAQIIDSLPWFKAEARLIGEINFIKSNTTFIIPGSLAKSLVSVSPSYAKKVQIPRTVRTSSRPITLKYNGNCYQFGCQKGQKCLNCQLHWYDKNRDGKVQPRQELRCGCDKGEQCRIRVRRVECR